MEMKIFGLALAVVCVAALLQPSNELQCYKCDNCATPTNAITCPAGSNSACEIIKTNAKTVKRGCGDQTTGCIPDGDSEACYCATDLCNDKVDSGAGTIAPTTGAILLGVALLSVWAKKLICTI
jgi:hypothetical protein